MTSMTRGPAAGQPDAIIDASGLHHLDDVASSRINQSPRTRFHISQANKTSVEVEEIRDRKPRHDGPQLSAPLSSTIEDTGDSLHLADGVTKRSKHAHISEGHSHTPEPLNTFIREVMETCQGESQFLPLNYLDEVVTIPNILRELELSNPNFDVHSTALQVWDRKTLSNGKFTTRRKLFVILCLMERAKDIQEFIEEGIFDADLPFDFEQSEGICRSKRRIKLFKGKSWRLQDIDCFTIYQGQVTSPYFKLSNSTNPGFLEYKLHPCVKLPFVDHEFKPSAAENSELHSAIRREGGYSFVRKVSIHSAHHDHIRVSMDHCPSEKMCFAVKELRKRDNATNDQSHELDRETTAYKYLNGRRHPHIIQLLATFTQRGHLNMIFPWADGNLLEFWQTHHPEVSGLPRNADLAEWMIGQLLGLAEAIRCIHHSEVEEIASYDAPDRSKTHGRHGDIKPENMLWFRCSCGGSHAHRQGKIVISDLGSTEFHATRSKTIPAEAAGGFTHTYRAPEFDKTKRVAPKADIWSFGCVVLQFLVWYVRGWDGVSSFAQARSDDSNLNFHADHFFNLVLKDDDHSDDIVVVKASVIRQCQMLREDSSTPDFIVDLVEFVQARLLEPDSAKRATCDEIVETFDAVKKKCSRNSGYCLPRARFEILRAPTDMSHKTSISLSSEMRKDYLINMKPTLRTPPPTPSDSGLEKLTCSALSHVRTNLLSPQTESQLLQHRHSTGQDFRPSVSMDKYPSLVTDDGRLENATSPASEGSTRFHKKWRSRLRAIKQKYLRVNNKS